MAKVSGPLMSMSASGKIADCTVYFTWKGVNVVRQWLKPSNPQSTGQGDRRIIAGGTGRAVGKITASEEYHQQLIDLELIPGGQTKQSYMVKYIIDNYISNATNYSTELACMKGHDASDDIGTVADALNISEFDLSYAAIDPYDKRLGIYLLAKAAIALNFTGSPYTKTLASWTATHWDALQSDLEG
jgi:hypothetical protein